MQYGGVLAPQEIGMDVTDKIANFLSEDAGFELEEAARPDSLADYQRVTASLTRQIGLAYNEAVGLKLMMDKMEEVTPSLKKTYDRMMKLIPALGKLKNTAYQSEMEMKRLR